MKQVIAPKIKLVKKKKKNKGKKERENKRKVAMVLHILNKTNARDFSPLLLQLIKTQHMNFITVHGP